MLCAEWANAKSRAPGAVQKGRLKFRREPGGRIGLREVLDAARDERGPARLMARAEAAAVSPWKYSWKSTRSFQCGSLA